jgi:hypothetical protein
MRTASNPSPAQELKEINRVQILNEQQTLALIDELAALQLKLETLNHRLNQNSHFAREHAQNKENIKRQQPVNPSGKFSSQIVNEFAFLAVTYEGLKAKLPQEIRREVSEIEDTTLAAASISKKEFDSLIFYPAFQSKHMQYAMDHARRYHDEEEAIFVSQQSIFRQHKETQTRFNNFYKVSGLLSIVGIGLPFLLIGSIANLIDRLKYSLQMKKLHNEMLDVTHKKDTNQHPQIAQLHTQIENNAEARLRQGFFKVGKAQISLELDVYLPKERPGR